MSADSKVAIITGATGGIGVALAQRLAADGWQLHLCDIEHSALEKLRQQLPANTSMVASALDSPQECTDALAQGPENIHALIHLAGVFEYHEMDAGAREIYDRTMQHNVNNAFDLCCAAEALLQSGGRIIFASSLAFRRGAADNAAYTMAKGALVGLTRALSRRLAVRNILVNAVAPGLIATPMLDEVMTRRDEQAMQASVPLGRYGSPAEIAG
ncbi:MAG: SDR family oxidoreductase, partial [Pseudomonadota bacterium]